MDLTDLLPETMEEVKKQLERDQEKWGDTWKYRKKEGQEQRILERIEAYFDQYVYGGVPFPWVKVIALAHIAMIRNGHPELLQKKKKKMSK